MKFLRLIILILLSLSIPLLGLAILVFLSAMLLYPEWKIFAIISCIFAGIIWLVSWFLLNKKAKIVGGIFGGILLIIICFVLFFLQNFSENPNENTTNIKGENILDNIFPLGENVLEFDKSEEKAPKYLSADKCDEVKNILEFLDNQNGNIFKKNQKTQEIEEKKEFFQNFLILSEIRNLIGKRNIAENEEKLIAEKWEEFKKISPNAKIIEKNLIFTEEYRENYESFLRIMQEILENYNGKIYCLSDDNHESGYLEIVRIL